VNVLNLVQYFSALGALAVLLRPGPPWIAASLLVVCAVAAAWDLLLRR